MRKCVWKSVCKALMVGVSMWLPSSLSASDICGQVFRNGGTNPGFDAMARQSFVYYMTTEDIAGEHWATILVSAYPEVDPQVDVPALSRQHHIVQLFLDQMK